MSMFPSRFVVLSSLVFGLLYSFAVPLAGQDRLGGYTKAVSAYHKGDLAIAQKLFASLSSHRSSCVDCNLYLGRIAAELSHLTESEHYLSKFTADNPSNPDGWYAFGYLRFLQKRASESLSALERAAQLRPPTTDELRLGGMDYVLLNDMAPAIDLFKRSLAQEPMNIMSRYYLGRALYTENQFADAIDEYKMVLDLSPHDIHAEDGLGLSYEALARVPEAETSFAQALAWNKQAVNPVLFPVVDFASFLVEQNRADEAGVLLCGALAQYPSAQNFDMPNFVRAQRLLGKIELQVGHPSEAVEHLSIAARNAPEDSSTHFLLGQAYKRRGDDDLAAAEFRLSQALMKIPNGR